MYKSRKRFFFLNHILNTHSNKRRAYTKKPPDLLFVPLPAFSVNVFVFTFATAQPNHFYPKIFSLAFGIFTKLLLHTACLTFFDFAVRCL